MSWTTPRTWTSTVVTASDLNTHIRDNELILKTQIADNGAIVGPLNGWNEKYQTNNHIVAGAVSFDIASGNHVQINLGANISSFTITNTIATGSGYVAPIVIYIVNDGTLRTVTWTVNSIAVKFAAGTAPTLTGTLNKVDIVTLMYFDSGTIYGFQTGYNM